MIKSKYVFLIMAVVYGAIAVGSKYNLIIVTENILFGLSLSALLSSLSDLLEKIIAACNAKNDFYFITSISLEFIENMSTKIPVNPGVSISTVKANTEELNASHRNATHPSVFEKEKFNVILRSIAIGFFIASISVFIFTPYLPVSIERAISVLITLLAFAIVCLNLFLDEQIAEISQKKFEFQKSEQFAIGIAYPNFYEFLNLRLYHNADYIAMKKQQEDNANANA